MKVKKILVWSLSIFLVLLVTIAIFSPSIVKVFGLHPDYERKQYNLKGKKALIVTTIHAVLNKPGETEGVVTGIFASEMTIPYYEFLDGEIRNKTLLNIN